MKIGKRRRRERPFLLLLLLWKLSAKEPSEERGSEEEEGEDESMPARGENQGGEAKLRQLATTIAASVPEWRKCSGFELAEGVRKLEHSVNWY